MNPVLENMLNSGYVQSPSGHSIKMHSFISRDQGKFLQTIIGETQPTNTLEIGLAFGVSALFICDALASIPNSRHIVVDPEQHNEKYWSGIGINNILEAGYHEKVEFYALPAHIILPRLESEERRIDFAFVDGNHTFDFALVDFFLIDKLLRQGGIIAFDDTWMPSIQRLCRFIITNRAYTVYRCFPESRLTSSKLSLQRRIVCKAAQASTRTKRILKVEYGEPDIDLKLGLFNSDNHCIAFRKESEDSREWDFHHDF